MKSIAVFRGQHGQPNASLFSTFLASLSFTTCPEVANTYATCPNDQTLTKESVNPHVIEADIWMEAPFCNTPDDPFLDMDMLIKHFGLQTACHFARKHATMLMDTNAWVDGPALEYPNLEDMLQSEPERLSELCVMGYVLADDKEFVAMLESAGFDGMIFAGCGAGIDSVEVRVWNLNQIKVKNSIPL